MQIPPAVTVLNSIIDVINALPINLIVFYGQIIGGVLSVIFLAGIIIVIQRMGAAGALDVVGKKVSVETGGESEAELAAKDAAIQEKALKAWKDVVEKIHSKSSSDWLAAVIQADAIFDGILKRMGLPGETMADRLQSLDSSKLKTLQDVWIAHKIRNRVAHEPATMLRHHELLDAVERYKKALKELEYID